MLILGLDPASEGGGVLTKDGECIAAMYWRTNIRDKRRVYTLKMSDGRNKSGLRTPWELGFAIRRAISGFVLVHGGDILVASESAYEGRNARTGLALSRFSGALVGPIEALDCARRETIWVESQKWRSASFRKKWWKETAVEHGKTASMSSANKRVMLAWDPTQHIGVGRKEIDKRMAKMAKSFFMTKREAAKIEAERVMPGLVPGLPKHVERCGGHEHVYDAAGVAYWASKV